MTVNTKPFIVSSLVTLALTTGLVSYGNAAEWGEGLGGGGARRSHYRPYRPQPHLRSSLWYRGDADYVDRCRRGAAWRAQTQYGYTTEEGELVNENGEPFGILTNPEAVHAEGVHFPRTTSPSSSPVSSLASTSSLVSADGDQTSPGAAGTNSKDAALTVEKDVPSDR